jgi:hypothetical protein
MLHCHNSAKTLEIYCKCDKQAKETIANEVFLSTARSQISNKISFFFEEIGKPFSIEVHRKICFNEFLSGRKSLNKIGGFRFRKFFSISLIC